jgi:hypothetical protein
MSGFPRESDDVPHPEEVHLTPADLPGAAQWTAFMDRLARAGADVVQVIQDIRQCCNLQEAGALREWLEEFEALGTALVRRAQYGRHIMQTEVDLLALEQPSETPPDQAPQ